MGEGGGGAEEGEVEGAEEGGMAIHAGGNGKEPGEDEEPDGGDCLKSAGVAFQWPLEGEQEASSPFLKTFHRGGNRKTEGCSVQRGALSATCQMFGAS